MGHANAPREAPAIAARGLAGRDDALLLAVTLDCIYQLMTIRFIYRLELLFTATLLALVPYALSRRPFNRLARVFLPLAPPPPI